LTMWKLVALITFASANAAIFNCRDLNRRCPQFRRNVARNNRMHDSPQACKHAGSDYNFLLTNCPVTCGLCVEAEAHFKKEEERKRKIAAYSKQNFRDTIAEECSWLMGSVWKIPGNRQRQETKMMLTEDGTFDDGSDECAHGRCRWGCQVQGANSVQVQINWHTRGLFDLVAEGRNLEGRSPYGETVSAQLVQKDLYRVMRIARDISKAQLRKQYRELSKTHHPDRMQGATDVDRARFEEINEAYELLSDPDRRRIYDAMGAHEFHNRQLYEKAVKRGKVNRIAGGFYRDSPVVKTFTSQTFFQAVHSANSPPTIVEFYAPWCFHCQQMVGIFKGAAILFESDNVVAGAVDCDANSKVCEKLGIRSYPTIRLFPGKGKRSKGVNYEGEHEAELMQEFVDSIVHSRVKQLDAARFRKFVLGEGLTVDEMSTTVWMVDFSAGAWCGPCQGLTQPLRNMARELESIFKNARSDEDSSAAARMRVRVGILNCDNNKELCAEQSVEHYPQLRLYSKATRDRGGLDQARPSRSAAEVVHGQRSTCSLQSCATSPSRRPQPLPRARRSRRPASRR